MKKLGGSLRPRLGGRGSRISTTAYAVAKEAGYPVIVKATAGGGGRGMKLARSERGAGNRGLPHRADRIPRPPRQ